MGTPSEKGNNKIRALFSSKRQPDRFRLSSQNAPVGFGGGQTHLHKISAHLAVERAGFYRL